MGDWVLGVIPARGGSKGIPGKNLRSLAGRPLLGYAIASALASRRLDQVVVSTEDPRIQAFAEAEGARVLRRPPELAEDETPMEPVLVHAVERLAEELGSKPALVVTLQPTSPLRSPETIDRCVELAASGAGSVFTVAETTEIFGRVEGERFVPLLSDQPRRRQDREPLYRESGTVYVTHTADLLEQGKVLCPPVRVVVVDEEEGIDLNVPLDLEIAAAVMNRRAQGATS